MTGPLFPPNCFDLSPYGISCSIGNSRDSAAKLGWGENGFNSDRLRRPIVCSNDISFRIRIPSKLNVLITPTEMANQLRDSYSIFKQSCEVAYLQDAIQYGQEAIDLRTIPGQFQDAVTWHPHKFSKQSAELS